MYGYSSTIYAECWPHLKGTAGCGWPEKSKTQQLTQRVYILPLKQLPLRINFLEVCSLQSKTTASFPSFIPGNNGYSLTMPGVGPNLKKLQDAVGLKKVKYNS